MIRRYLPQWRDINFRIVGAVIFILTLIFFFYFWKLGTITQGLSQTEASFAKSSQSVKSTSERPLFLPYKLAQKVSMHFGYNNPLLVRLPSAIFGLVVLACFFYFCRRWFGDYIAFLATLSFLAIPWVTLLARNGTSNIMYLMPIVVAAIWLYLISDKSKNYVALPVFASVVALSLYVPGMFWLLLISAFIVRWKIVAVFAESSVVLKSLSGLLTALLLAPAVVAITKDLTVARELLLIPGEISSPAELIKIAVYSIATLAYKARIHLEIIIGRLPMFDITVIVLSLIGFVAMWIKARAKSISILSLIFFGLITATLNDNPYLLTFVVPPTFVFFAAGLRFLYLRWSKIFPLNPVPRFLAISLIGIVVGLNIFYGLRYSLIAWPNTPETTKTFVVKLD